jgi:cytochrome P450
MDTEFLKASYFYQNVGISESLATMTDPRKHREFRKVCKPFFSITSVEKMSHHVHREVEIAQNNISQNTGKVLDLHEQFRCTIVRALLKPTSR